MYVEAAHINEFVANGQAQISDVQLSQDFGNFLNSMTWNTAGTALLWDDIPHVRVDLSSVSGAKLHSAVVSASIARHEFVLVMYNPNQPGLICSLDFSFDNLDELYWLAPANRYMCGVDIGRGVVSPVYEDLCEYSDNQYLTLTVS